MALLVNGGRTGGCPAWTAVWYNGKDTGSGVDPVQGSFIHLLNN